MEELIAAFPSNIGQAYRSTKTISFKIKTNEISNVVLLGMGGSGIGAKIVSKWVQDEIKVPILLSQDYDIPAFIGKNTLVIACSYSGNTEETVISAEKAFQAGATVVGLCSGGKIEQFCTTNKLDCVHVPGGNPPRTTTAFSIVHILNILNKFELISLNVLNKVLVCEEFLTNHVEEIKNNATEIADFLHNHTAIIYSSVAYESIVLRARQQLNENSKELCIGNVIPEMNHNELVGWTGGNNNHAALFLDPQDLNDRNVKRFEVTIEEAKRWTKQVMVVKAKGDNMVQRSMFLMHLIDWTSLFLANLKNVDAVDIRAIDYLKNELEKLA